MSVQEEIYSHAEKLESKASRNRLSIEKRTVKSKGKTMRGLFKIGLCFLLLFTSCVFFQANVVFALEEILDQGQTGGGGNAPFIINEGNSVYQTFRAGYTGELNRVRVMIRNNSLMNWAEEGLVRIQSRGKI